MRRALIVGIDHYKGGPLKASINDAKNIYKVLSRNDDNSVNFDCRIMTSTEEPKITVRQLKKEIFDLLYQEAEVAVLYFSGHGASTEFGGYLVTQDSMKYQEGVSLDEILTLANTSKVNEVIIILDCCFSGKLGNLKGIGNRTALLREGVSILTSSRDTQKSYEKVVEDEDDKKTENVFTSIIIDALSGGAADILGNVNVTGMYNYINQLLTTWEQRPILKSHISKMVSVRKCKPKIELEKLREITTYFKTKDFQYQLDPTFDKDIDPSNEENQKIMEDFREYYKLELLVPSKEKYMYYAAKNSDTCKLTNKGQYFWDMVKYNRV